MKKITHFHRVKFFILLSLILAVALSGIFVLKGWILKKIEPQQLTTIRLPVDIWPGNFWILVAQANGYFKEENLNIELIDVSADYFGWLDHFIKTDDINTMVVTIFDLLEQNIKGSDIVGIFQSDSSLGAEGILAKDQYTKLSQLRGKRIGVEDGTYLNYFFDTAMLVNGISADDFILVNIKTDDLYKAYASGDVDAIVIWEPNLSQIKNKYGGNKVFDTSKIRGFSSNVFIFQRKFVNSNPEVMRRLILVWEKATSYIKEHHQETVNLISKYQFKSNQGKLFTTDEIQELMDKDPISDWNDNVRALHFSSGFESLYGNLQYALRYFQRSNKSLPKFNLNDMIETRFILNSY